MSIELAWAAGLFDGEGNAGTHTSRTGPPGVEYRYLTLQIGMTDRRPLDRFACAVGVGNVNGPYRSKSYKPNHASIYRWAVQGVKAERAANLLAPYLSEPKREQIARHIPA